VASDIRYLQQLDFPAYAVNLDWLLTDQNLIADGYDLQSAVIVALGTDALAPITEELPDFDSTDRRGWWADMDAQEIWGGWPVGCLLWLLRRAKITPPGARVGSTLARADGWTRDAMRPFMAEVYGNPASAHQAGRRARQALEDSRERTAALLGAHPDEVIFTSGATAYAAANAARSATVRASNVR
jgi:phage gp46-like protein